MTTEPMADEEEFAAFLRCAPLSEVGEQALVMLGSVERAQDAIRDVEWSRVSRTVARMKELVGDAPPLEARREMDFALRACTLFAELDEKLAAMATEQHGN